MGFPDKSESQPEVPLRGHWPYWWLLGAGILLVIAASVFMLRPQRLPLDGDQGPIDQGPIDQGPISDLPTDAAASSSPAAQPLAAEKPFAAPQPDAAPQSLVPDVPAVAETKPREPFFADLTAPPKTVAELMKEAEHVMATMIDDFPNLTDSYELRARFLNWCGETAEAVKEWEHCLEIDPRYAHAYLGLGRIAVAQGRYADATELYRKALEISSFFPEAQAELARAFIDQGQPDEAIAMLEKQESAQSPEWHFLLGQAYALQQNYDEACRHYQAAANLNPGYADAHYGWATALVRLDREDEAKVVMDRFHELSKQNLQSVRTEKDEFDDLVAASEDIAVMYANIGALYLTRGQAPAAEQLWRRAAQLAPRNVECRQGLAWLLQQAGKPQDAIDVLTQLAEIAPTPQIYWVEIGRLHARADDFDAAEQAFRKACETDSQTAEGYLSLAQLYLQANRKLDEALELVERAAQRSDAAEVDELRAAIRKKQDDAPAESNGVR